MQKLENQGYHERLLAFLLSRAPPGRGRGVYSSIVNRTPKLKLAIAGALTKEVCVVIHLIHCY